MKLCFPDYANCGVNVASSILKYCGVAPSHATLPALDALLESGKYQNVVLMLFDGLGMDALSRHLPKERFLRAHVAQELSAVCPATTTAATTAIECGQTPVEHGWLGWTLYFKEIDKAVDIFTNQCSGAPAADYPIAPTLIPRTPIFPRINAAGRVKACCVSRYGDTHIDTLDELFDKTLALCLDDEPRYIYAYWGEPDWTMHERGCSDLAVTGEIDDIDRRVQALCEQVGDDTLVLVTADHGLIDAQTLYLCDYPMLYSMLMRTTACESRMTVCYVKPDFIDAFPRAFFAVFSRDDFMLMKSGEALARGYFGDGEEHPRARDFLGDYVIMATGDKCLAYNRSGAPLLGVHAGLTEQEMRVPLIIAKA